MLATERLKVNPADVEAINMLVDVERKVCTVVLCYILLGCHFPSPVVSKV